jgi:hypothetical protein
VAKDPHPRGELDWASASVGDGELEVALTGTPNAEWVRGLESIIERLYRPGSGWGEIKVAKAAVRVVALTPGCETDLRHFLEAAVLQVNANFAPPEDSDESADEGQSAEDREMTETFRSFSDEGTEPGDEPDESTA